MNDNAPEPTDSNVSVDDSGQSAPSDPSVDNTVDIFSGLDEDTKAYAENKGWAGAPDIINSYKNLEKMVGGRLSIPEEDDPDGWNDLYNRLGRPESHDQYELDVPDGANGEVVDWFKQTAHEVGMTQAQAERFFGSYNEMLASRNEEMAAQAEAENTQQMQELQKEWGSGYEANLSKAQEAAQRLGMDEQMIDGMASAIGLKATLAHFAKIGEAIGEDAFAGGPDAGGHAGNVGLTPAQAQAQINDLLGDPNFKARYQRGEQDAVQRVSNLYALTSAS